MNLLKTNNTLDFSGTRPAVAALLFALALGVSTLASAAPKAGPGAKNQPVQATPDVCTIQVDLADVADTNAPDGEAPLSLIVSTQTQLWAQDVSASSPNNQASSQSQSSRKSVEADASGFLTPDAVDTAVAGYILEEGTAEVVQICSEIRTDSDSPHASEIHCQELVLSSGSRAARSDTKSEPTSGRVCGARGVRSRHPQSCGTRSSRCPGARRRRPPSPRR